MSLQKATFSITCDGNGQGYDDVTLHLGRYVRHGRIVSVSVDVSDAIISKSPTVTISELVDVSAEAWNDSTEDYELGDQVFFVDLGSSVGDSEYPSRGEVYEYGVSSETVVSPFGTSGSVIAQPLIRSKFARCQIYNGGVTSNPLTAATDAYTVNLYYETAGDYRF